MAAAAAAKKKEEEERLERESAQRAARIAEQDAELQRILNAKEQRDQDAKDSAFRRDAIQTQLSKNKTKKESKKREAALASAKAKIDQKATELAVKQRQKEEMAKAQLSADEKKKLKKQQKEEEERRLEEQRQADMEAELARIADSAKEAEKRAKEKKTLKIKHDSDLDDDGSDGDDDVALAQAKAAALQRAADLLSHTDVDLQIKSDIKTFDDPEIDFDMDLEMGDGEDNVEVKDLEQKRLEIESSLKNAKEIASKKTFTFEEDDANAKADNFALEQARAAAILNASKSTKGSKKKEKSIPRASSDVDTTSDKKIVAVKKKVPKDDKEKKVKKEKDKDGKEKKKKSSKISSASLGLEI